MDSSSNIARAATHELRPVDRVRRAASRALAGILVGLAVGPFAGCGEPPPPKAPALSVVSGTQGEASTGSEVTSFRIEGHGVRRMTVRLLAVRRGKVRQIGRLEFEPSSNGPVAGSLTLLEQSGKPFGQDGSRCFELMQDFSGVSLVKFIGRDCSRNLRMQSGGGEHVRRVSVQPEREFILGSWNLWPPGTTITGGVAIRKIEDAEAYTSKNPTIVILVTLSWKT